MNHGCENDTCPFCHHPAHKGQLVFDEEEATRKREDRRRAAERSMLNILADCGEPAFFQFEVSDTDEYTEDFMMQTFGIGSQNKSVNQRVLQASLVLFDIAPPPTF